MDTRWFWKYTVTLFDDEYSTVVGITIGDTMAQAVEALEKYYGSSLVSLNYLEAIVDGVLDFTTAKEYGWDIEVYKTQKDF